MPCNGAGTHNSCYRQKWYGTGGMAEVKRQEWNGRGGMAGVKWQRAEWQGGNGRGGMAGVEWQAIHDKDTPQQQTRQEAAEEVGQGSRSKAGSSAPLPWQ